MAMWKIWVRTLFCGVLYVVSLGAFAQGLNGSLVLPPRLAAEGDLSGSSGVQRQGTGQAGSQSSEGNGVWVLRGAPTWGALAKDFQLPGAEGIGIANNWLTQEDAAREAMQRCYQSGGVNCYLETTYSNRCLGIALADNGQIYWEINVTKSMAAQSAMVTCSEKSPALCKLVFAECSYPVP